MAVPPAGFALAHAFLALTWVWFPMLLGWAAKGTILRFGGMKQFRAWIPFFLGLILGDIVIGVFSSGRSSAGRSGWISTCFFLDRWAHRGAPAAMPEHAAVRRAALARGRLREKRETLELVIQRVEAALLLAGNEVVATLVL